MTDEPLGDREGRFKREHPAPDSALPDPGLSRAKLDDSLHDIEAFLDQAVRGGRDAFTRASPAYASGSMVVIRTAALFETDEFAQFLTNVSPEVAQGTKTTRNIASHSGYRSMNYDIFWTTLTVHLPVYPSQWRKAAQ